MRRLIVLVLAIASLPVLSRADAQALRAVDNGWEVSRRHAVSAATLVQVAGMSGSVEVRGSSQASGIVFEERVRIRAGSRQEAERILAGLALPERAGSAVTLRDTPVRDVQRHLRVVVPRAVRVEVELAGGSILLEGTAGPANLRTSGGSVSVRSVEGNVYVSSAGGHLSAVAIQGRFRATTSGGAVEVSQVSDVVNVVTAGGAVSVEETGAAVKVATAGGGVTVRSAEGLVEVSTAGGAIHVQNLGGEASLSTAGGDIEIRSAAGYIRASTSGGDVEASGLRRGADLETLAGDMDLSDVGGPLRLRTAVGDVFVRLRSSETVPDLIVRSQLGDIEVELPEGISAELDASLAAAGALSRNDIISDFPVTREPAGPGQRIRSRGRVGDGAGTVRLEAQDGSIRIRAIRR